MGRSLGGGIALGIWFECSDEAENLPWIDEEGEEIADGPEEWYLHRIGKTWKDKHEKYTDNPIEIPFEDGLHGVSDYTGWVLFVRGSCERLDYCPTELKQKEVDPEELAKFQKFIDEHLVDTKWWETLPEEQRKPRWIVWTHYF